MTRKGRIILILFGLVPTFCMVPPLIFNWNLNYPLFLGVYLLIFSVVFTFLTSPGYKGYYNSEYWRVLDRKVIMLNYIFGIAFIIFGLYFW